MEINHKQTSFMLEIDNFWEKESVISSRIFFSGGCQWYVNVYPKGYGIDDHLSLYLCVANPESVRLGWKIRAATSIVVLNQSNKELYRMHESCNLLCAQFSEWGNSRALSLEKLKEEGVLEKNKVFVKVEIKVEEVVQGDVTGKEMLDIRGFQVLYSKVASVSQLFEKHPDIAVNFVPKNQMVKTRYMNKLLDLIERLNKPPHSFTETELSNAQKELIRLTEAGFKLDWLKTKVDNVSFERMRAANHDGSSLVEEDMKNNIEVAANKRSVKDWLKKKLDKVSFARKIANHDEFLNKKEEDFLKALVNYLTPVARNNGEFLSS